MKGLPNQRPKPRGFVPLSKEESDRIKRMQIRDLRAKIKCYQEEIKELERSMND